MVPYSKERALTKLGSEGYKFHMYIVPWVLPEVYIFVTLTSH